MATEQPIDTGTAKAAGVYKGRPPSIEALRPVDIAKALKIGRASVYRVLASSG